MTRARTSTIAEDPLGGTVRRTVARIGRLGGDVEQRAQRKGTPPELGVRDTEPRSLENPGVVQTSVGQSLCPVLKRVGKRVLPAINDLQFRRVLMKHERNFLPAAHNGPLFYVAAHPQLLALGCQLLAKPKRHFGAHAENGIGRRRRNDRRSRRSRELDRGWSGRSWSDRWRRSRIQRRPGLGARDGRLDQSCAGEDTQVHQFSPVKSVRSPAGSVRIQP